MGIKTSILKRLVSLVCAKGRVRRRLVEEFSRAYTTELVEELSRVNSTELIDGVLRNHINAFVRSALNIDSNRLLGPMAEILQQQSITDQELNILAHAANATFHYSQEGEDIILDRFFGRQEKGFYVDVGAHHPIRFSNTYALYRKGWRGINIDATPGSMAAFDQWRPQDTNIEAAVSDTPETMPFYIFKEPALNTFDSVLAETYIKTGWERQEIKDLAPRQLSDILDECLPSGIIIDFMSIDVEGEEMGVLRSNNWEKYAPRYLMLEILDVPLAEIVNTPAVVFLREHGYVPISKLVQTVILQRQLMI